MLGFTLTRHAGISVLQLNGEAHGDESIEALNQAFTLVQPDDQLVLELSEALTLDATVASTVQEMLRMRHEGTQTVVVSPRRSISNQLTLHGVDHVSSIVRTMAEALDVLAALRWARGQQC